MSNIAIQFDHVGKLYHLGVVGTGTLSHDLNRWWQTRILHHEDPYLKIGETNDRSTKGSSDFVWALKDITFDVAEGDVVGIIGKNGAGKSTLLKLLSRVTSPTTGAIRARGRIASLLEVGTGFHPEMTGRENIYMNGSIMGMTRAEISRKLDEIVDFAGVERYLDTPVKRYSSGMTVRLGFAVAAFLEPEILVVDEVLAVGDAEFQKKAIGKMQDVSRGEGRTVLFVSHNMDSMLNLCTKGVLLENGMVKYSGDIQSTVTEYLTNSNNVKEYNNNDSQYPIYVSNAKLVNPSQNGDSSLFSFKENVEIQMTFKKNPNLFVDKKTVVSIKIVTKRNTQVCTTEIPISPLVDNEQHTVTIKYPSEIIAPGNYYFSIITHIPNVRFYEKINACDFTIYDNGSEFLKYGGKDTGVVLLRPEIIIK